MRNGPALWWSRSATSSRLTTGCLLAPGCKSIWCISVAAAGPDPDPRILSIKPQ